MHFQGDEQVKQALIDTDILSLFFRGHPQVVAQFGAYTKVYDKINISIITYYEILSGLKHRDAHKQLEVFLDFTSQNEVIPLTESSVSLSADMYAATRTQGSPIDDIDILIAGIAMANDWVMVTHNRKHFEKLDGIEIKDWSEEELD
jgi:tRNA(fMet)-specific endonuclease VapC